MTKQIDILRPNTSLAAVADVALPLAQAQGSAAAARAMRDAGVPDRVTARVLCEPPNRSRPPASTIGTREQLDEPGLDVLHRDAVHGVDLVTAQHDPARVHPLDHRVE